MTAALDSLLPELSKIIWGPGIIGDEIFDRWCQEPTALVQDGGGPCAVLAAVQAVILREIIFTRKQKFSELTAADSSELLVSAVLNIVLLTAGDKKKDYWYWAHWSQSEESEPLSNQSESDNFFHGLRLIEASSADELHGVIMSLVPELQSKYGVLCFLYSILFNYGIESLRHGMADDADTLIDPVYGHASQCLINLLISGQATPYLFDGERNVSGISCSAVAAVPVVDSNFGNSTLG
ncbi:unnamed protein product [Echinostoma caproni]|uniref:Ubiquitin carboxyl-terminal hydrolase MINDY n=1 Tax=Echinostoma caproni TaxID=27848 RepID=A0A183B1F4_9TREM|nr:unnamed protein product [Echinostoma caproni]